MRYIIISLVLAFISMAQAQREAYVVNSLAETLSLIDLETGAVTNHIITLGETPNQVVVYDGYLYVVNSISADVMKINAATRQLETTFLLPLGSNPYFMTFNGGYGFVAGWVSGKVYRLNLGTNGVDGEVEIGGYPEGLLCSDGYLYVAQTYFDPNTFSYGQGKLAKIDLSDFTFVADYNVGKNPQWISGSPDGKLHIVCTGNYADVEGSVYIFDPAIDMVIDSILIGGQPGQLAIAPTGTGFLSAGGWSTSGYIFSYDIFTGDIIRGPANPIEVGLGASAVAADSLGFVFSCNFGDDTVSKIDFSGNVIGSYPLGDGPISISILDDTVIGIGGEGATPEIAYLITGYPNPFNSGAIIAFEDFEETARRREILIYDIAGRFLKTLKPETLGGYGKVYWDGTDDEGKRCSSGIYFARLSVNDERVGDSTGSMSLKMTLIR